MRDGEDLLSLQGAIHETAKAKGWWDEPKRSFGELIALCHSELSEALEEHRNGAHPTDIYYNPDNKPEGIPIELADAIIRICDMAEAFNIDLGRAVRIKMKYNETRPHRHGGKVI